MITINKPRFRKIFKLIFSAYKNKTGIFSTLTAENSGPQKIYIPKDLTPGDEKHIYWLALVAMSDRRTNSKFLYKNFAQMFTENPHLFTVGFSLSIDEMTQLFRQYQIAVPVGDIDIFIQRKDHLDRFFNGEPKKIYEGVSNIEELLKRFKKIAKEHDVKILFPGAKGKIFSLLAMFLSELTDFDFADIIPIDVWVQSIVSSSGILKGKGQITVSKLEKELRPLMSKLHKEYRGDDGSGNATWLLGRYGCNRCVSSNMKDMCPIYHQCKGPFARHRHEVSRKHQGVITVPSAFKGKFKK